MPPYQLLDENNELMRIVNRQEEARQLQKERPEWQVKFVKRKKPESFKFEEAPF